MNGEYDERFEKLESLIKRTMGGVDEMRLEMRDFRKEVHSHSSRFDNLDARLDALNSGFKIVSGRQEDVIPKVIGIQTTVNRISDTQSEQTFKIIEMLNRLDRMEILLKSLDERATQTESEIKDIRAVIHSLVDPVLIGSDLRSTISEIDQRLTNIEEKLAA